MRYALLFKNSSEDENWDIYLDTVIWNMPYESYTVLELDDDMCIVLETSIERDYIEEPFKGTKRSLIKEGMTAPLHIVFPGDSEWDDEWDDIELEED